MALLLAFYIPGLYLDSSFICPLFSETPKQLELMPLNAGSKLIDRDWASIVAHQDLHPILFVATCTDNRGRPLCFTETTQVVHTRKYSPSRIPCFETVFFLLLLPLGSNVPEPVGEGWKKGRALPVTLVVRKGLVIRTMKCWCTYNPFDFLWYVWRHSLQAIFWVISPPVKQCVCDLLGQGPGKMQLTLQIGHLATLKPLDLKC